MGGVFIIPNKIRYPGAEEQLTFYFSTMVIIGNTNPK